MKTLVTEKIRTLHGPFSDGSFDATREDIRRGYAIGPDGGKRRTRGTYTKRKKWSEYTPDVNEPQTVANFDTDLNAEEGEDSQYKTDVDIQSAYDGTAYQRLASWSQRVKEFDEETDDKLGTGWGERVRELADSMMKEFGCPDSGLDAIEKFQDALKEYADLYISRFETSTEKRPWKHVETPEMWRSDIRKKINASREDRLSLFRRTGRNSKLPESAEKPFDGMSVANMRFLNEWTEDDEVVEFGPKDEEPNYEVGFWPGGGYHLHKVIVNADSEEQALEKAVVQLEKDNLTGLILDPAEVEAEAEKDGIYNSETGEGTPEFYETYMYVDATMEGASQPWYVYAENLRIRKISPFEEF